MTKINGLIILLVSLAIVLSGCGEPNPGYKIHRIDNTLLVFLSINDRSKIVDTKIDNTALHVDIKTDKKIEKRVISLQHTFVDQLITPNETLEIHGTDRINGYGVVHLTISSRIPRRFSMSFNWTGIKVKGFTKKPGPFGNSSAFRVGDRLIAYRLIPEIKESSWKVSKFGITVEFTDTAPIDDVEIDAKGGRILNIETDDLDIPIQNLSFLLKGILPHETVEVENKKMLGGDIFLAYLRVYPK